MFHLALLVCALSSAAAATQEQRAREVEALLATSEARSLPWFLLGFELAEAQQKVDLRLALATAERLLESAGADSPPGAYATATALAALSAVALEGTLPAAELIQRSRIPPPPDAAPALRATYHLARSRLLCFANEEAQEFDAAIAGRAAALESGDPLLAARAALIFHHVSPDGGTDNQRATLDEAATRVGEAGSEYLRTWLLSHEHIFHKEAGRGEEANRILDELEALARAQGNHRALGFVQLRRARFHNRERNDAEAIAMYRLARETMERVGDRMEIAHLIEFEADSEIRRGNLGRAQALVAEDLAWIEGRGLPECEQGILQTRFDLAVQERDGELAAELAKKLERGSAAEETESRRYVEVRERLARSEAERQATEARLREEQERIAARARLTWTFGSVLALLALAAVVTVALVSRRKLITANEKLRAEVRRANEAQEASARLERRLGQLERTESLGMLASGIAHDFNNLLVCVLGSAEMLVLREDDPERRALVQAIQSAGEQAARLCRQLQAYVGNAPVDTRPIDLAVLLRDILPVLKAAGNGRTVVDTTPDGLAVAAMADRGQLEQVLLNLVANARDAGATTMTLRASHQVLAAADIERLGILGLVQPGQYGVLDVADDGAGMSPDVVGRIFDPFFTTRFPGRGLGLAVAYGVVRRHGGGFQVESTPGAGSRFRVYLPEAQVKAWRADVLLPQPTRRAARRGTIVIVDDEPGVRRMLARALGSAGHATIEVESGADTLATLALLPTEAAPVLLLDLTMPSMDGSEVLRRVRAEHPRVPIVLMSGQGSSLLEESALELRPDGFLPKPFDCARLLEVIASAESVRGAHQSA